MRSCKCGATLEKGSRCNPCAAAYQREHRVRLREQNPEKFYEQQRRWKKAPGHKARTKRRYERLRADPEKRAILNERSRLSQSAARAREPIATWIRRAVETINARTRPEHDRVTLDVLRLVYERDGGACIDCDSVQRLTFGHLVPLVYPSVGLLVNGPENLALQCKSCNSRQACTIHPRAGRWKLVRAE